MGHGCKPPSAIRIPRRRGVHGLNGAELKEGKSVLALKALRIDSILAPPLSAKDENSLSRGKIDMSMPKKRLGPQGNDHRSAES